MKIMVIGYSGAGKSTLAKILASHYHLPVLFIDTLQFEANWIDRDPELRDQDLLHFMETNEAWVIDGNYNSSFFDLRVLKADQIYILNYNRFVCFKNALLRRIKYRNQSRDCMKSGCKERLNLEFAWWLLHKGRSKQRASVYSNLTKIYPEKVHMFKNRRALNKYLILQNIQKDKRGNP